MKLDCLSPERAWKVGWSNEKLPLFVRNQNQLCYSQKRLGSDSKWRKIEYTKAKAKCINYQTSLSREETNIISPSINDCFPSLNWRVSFILHVSIYIWVKRKGKALCTRWYTEIFHWQINTCHFTLAERHVPGCVCTRFCSWILKWFCY